MTCKFCRIVQVTPGTYCPIHYNRPNLFSGKQADNKEPSSKEVTAALLGNMNEIKLGHIYRVLLSDDREVVITVTWKTGPMLETDIGIIHLTEIKEIEEYV